MKASRALVAGIVAVCVLAVIGTAYAGRGASHPKAPAGEMQSSAGVVMVRPGPAPLIPPPDDQVAGPTPTMVRGPAIPPDTVSDGKAGVVP